MEEEWYDCDLSHLGINKQNPAHLAVCRIVGTLFDGVAGFEELWENVTANEKASEVAHLMLGCIESAYKQFNNAKLQKKRKPKAEGPGREDDNTPRKEQKNE